MQLCAKCSAPHERDGQRYCGKCHAAYMRDWRKSHPMSELQKQHDNSRSYANTYLRRGKIKRQPCIVCGLAKAEMHHPNHEKPREVVWLCRACHLAWHAIWRRVCHETFLAWLGDSRRKAIVLSDKSEAA